MSNNKPSTFRLTRHTVTKRWRIERNDGHGSGWYHVQDVLCESGWGGRTFLFRWHANWVMCNMIVDEMERVAIENGSWEVEG